MSAQQTPPHSAREARVSIQNAIPELTRSITLKTAYAQRVYKRAFDRLKADLYVLTVRMRANGLEDAARIIEKQLDEEFKKVGADLNMEIERVEVLMSNAGVVDHPTYERAETYQAKFSTPKANEFLNLLIRMDSLLVRFDALWLTGAIETHVCIDNSINWQRRLTKVANRQRDRGNQARGTCDKAYRERMQRKRPSAAPSTAPGSEEGTQSSLQDDELTADHEFEDLHESADDEQQAASTTNETVE